MEELICKQHECRLEKLEDRMIEVEKTQSTLIERLDNTNKHLEDIKELFRGFPEAEKDIWENHWNKLLAKWFSQQKLTLLLLAGAIIIILMLIGGDKIDIAAIVKSFFS